MLTDCFVRVFSSSELRLGFAIASVARWKMQKDVNVVVLQYDGGIHYNFRCKTITISNSPDFPYATGSHKIAEELATSDPYIVTNDDNLIYQPDFVQKGLNIMSQREDFGIISGCVANNEHFASHENFVEIHAVGGLTFLRRGLLKEFPPLEDAFWDGERHRQIIEKGFRSGSSKELPYFHMGEHYSIANPAFFNGV